MLVHFAVMIHENVTATGASITNVRFFLFCNFSASPSYELIDPDIVSQLETRNNQKYLSYVRDIFICRISA